MPDENGTEATQDAQNAYESLFGDKAPKPAATAVEQEEANKTDQGRQGSDSAQNKAGGDESGTADDQVGEDETRATEDLKVVVSIREGKATIGVQRPSSDPHIELVDDPDLSGLVREVPAVIERARARWEDAPRYPAHERPSKATRRRTSRGQGSAQEASTAEGGAAQDQPQTLRLF